MTAPLVLQVTQSAAADQYDNLRATGELFEPRATGSFIGAIDSSGLFFLDGYVERQGDGLAGEVGFRWQLEDGRLVPFTINGRTDDQVDVQLSVRIGASTLVFNEIWRLSAMIR